MTHGAFWLLGYAAPPACAYALGFVLAVGLPLIVGLAVWAELRS